VSTPGPAAPPPGTVRCPRCGAAIGPAQDWCLECGAAARTRLAATPNWRLPVAAIATIVVLAVLALVIAFAALTDGDDERVPGITPAPTVASTPPPGAVGGAPTTTPSISAVTGATGPTGAVAVTGPTGPTGPTGAVALPSVAAPTGASGGAAAP